MRRAALLVSSLALVLAAACSKSDATPAPAGSGASTPSTATAPAPTTPTPAAPSPASAKTEYTAGELWTAAAGMMRLDILEKPAVTVSGTIKVIKDDPMGEYAIDLDADGGHLVELRFADFGKSEKAKKLKAGAAVTATTCKLTVPAANVLALTECTLK